MGVGVPRAWCIRVCPGSVVPMATAARARVRVVDLIGRKINVHPTFLGRVFSFQFAIPILHRIPIIIPPSSILLRKKLQLAVAPRRMQNLARRMHFFPSCNQRETIRIPIRTQFRVPKKPFKQSSNNIVSLLMMRRANDTRGVPSLLCHSLSGRVYLRGARERYDRMRNTKH